MNDIERGYRRARGVLGRPNPRLAAAIAAGNVEWRRAQGEVRAMLAAGGDPQALYNAETDKSRRIVLMGVLRRGMSALD